MVFSAEAALLFVAIVILLSIFANKVTYRFGMPMLLCFIILGILFGSDGVLKIQFSNFDAAGTICSICLIFIMFFGGFCTDWIESKSIAGIASLLSSMGVVLTALFTGLFCHFVLRIAMLESMLIGAVLGSTDAASVFSILRSKRLHLKDHTGVILEMESGSNDPFSNILTIIVLTMLGGTISPSRVGIMLVEQVGIGLLVGFGLAWISTFILRKVTIEIDGFETIFVLAIAILSYALPTVIGGNGYLSAYIVGICLGNAGIRGVSELKAFFSGLTGLMQIMIFFLLGLLSFPREMPKVLPIALPIFAFVTLIGRPAAIFLLMIKDKASLQKKLLISWSGLRGASSIVFAIMALMSSVQTQYDLFHIVFVVVLLSISIQGALLPWVAKKWDMIGEERKNLTDYTKDNEIQFIKVQIHENSPWQGKYIRDLVLPKDLLISLIIRYEGVGKKIIYPRGDTAIEPGDIIVMCAAGYKNKNNLKATEMPVGKSPKYVGKKIAEIEDLHDKLVLVIKRGDRLEIPRGDTVILEDDILVINKKSLDKTQ